MCKWLYPRGLIGLEFIYIYIYMKSYINSCIYDHIFLPMWSHLMCIYVTSSHWFHQIWIHMYMYEVIYIIMYIYDQVHVRVWSCLMHVHVTLSYWCDQTWIHKYVRHSPSICMHIELLQTLLFWLIGLIHIHLKRYQIFYVFCHVINPFTLIHIIYHTLFWF